MSNPSSANAAGKKPQYKRVLVKISGQLIGGQTQTFDHERLKQVATQLKAMHDLGVETAVVVGGGNIVRGAQMAASHDIRRETADQMGMLATVMNGLALRDILEEMGQETRVMSAVEMNQFAEPYIWRRAMRHLRKGHIVIFVAGTGNPYFSTDTAAALRASEIGADLLIKATQVGAVYSSDPAAGKDAKKYDKISFDACLEQKLGIMDAAAFILCRDNGLPILVLNLFDPSSLVKAVQGETVGTLVS